MRALIAAAMLAMAFAGPTQAQQGASAPGQFTHLDMFSLGFGGVNRSVGLYVPHSYQRGRPAPLIIALHGRHSSAQAMHAMSHLAAVAERRGAILFYPETAGAYWNDQGPGTIRRHDPPQDDVGFINAALNAVAQDYPIDREHMYLVGYDNGGAMAYSMACRGPMHFAGVAIVSALMWNYTSNACANARATPMLIMHGERDDLFPTEGGPIAGSIAGSGGAQLLSASATIDVWRRVNGCGGSGAASGGDIYSPNCSGAPLAYVSVNGGEHDWFHDGAGYQLNKQGVDATATIDHFLFDRGSFSPPTGQGAARLPRSWIVYVPPSYNPARPTPLVFVLHGRPSNAPAMAAISQMNAVAARRGFIVVYPQGLNNEWNAYYDLVRQPAIAPQDDISFLKTLTEDLGVDLNVDRRRMYVTGFSNGGFMTLRLACSASNYFAAFAPVSAELYTQLTSRCQGNPAPILLMHGTRDPSVPYDGVVQNSSGAVPGDLDSPMRSPGASRFGPSGMGSGGAAPQMDLGLGGSSGPIKITLTAFETAAFFTRRNHCDHSGTQSAYPQGGQSPGTSVIRFASHGCENNDDVVFYVINGGGHTWAGVPGVLGDALGPVNQDINAGEEIWNFFSRHSLSHDPQ